ncbi:bacterial transcriptional activator domain-containing protein [Nitrospira sp. KM1]|uniref:bacterial transcriptional activator domain-containing protein n=1 Tax=Nitrospira sp. KM1 TaxID=1936990 RepID=UPI00156610F4|nr:bacterial transcriptional activator domain-containing protein [Nitrospira sp. KM1]
MSGKKRLLFLMIILLVVVLGPLCILEIGLRVSGFKVPEDPFLSFGSVPDFFVKREVDGKLYYQVAHRDVYSERLTSFPAEKGPNTFRVICLGASASAGWPHQGDEIYSAYLQQALQRAFPDRRIEVLNLSAHAYAAYRVRLIFEETLEFQPDAFVIWSGNNEFLERRVYRTGYAWAEPVFALANKSLLYRGFRGSRVGRWLFPENTLSAHERGHHLFTMWSKLEQVAVALRMDPAQFDAVKRHFESSMESMVEQAEARNIPVILTADPTNLREWHPAVSCNSVTGAKLEQWQSHYHEGRRELMAGRHAQAVTALEASVALDPQYAEGYFYLGRAFEAVKQFDRAYSYYRLARDYDCNPFRSISAFEESVRRIAERHANVTVGGLGDAFYRATAPAIPGFDLFVDHVHPTKPGNLVAAETVFNALVKTGRLGATAGVPRFTHVPKIAEPGGKPYDDWEDAAMQALLVRFYMSQHQSESIVHRSRFLLERPALRAQLTPKDIEFLEKAVPMFTEIVQSEERWIRGEAPDPREPNKAKLLEFYKTTFEGYEEYKQKYGKPAS